MKLAPVLTVLFVACGQHDPDPAGPDSGTDPIPKPGTPILERDSRGTHACQVLDAPDEVAGNTAGSAIALVGDTPLVARASWGLIGDDEYGSILAVAPATFSPMALGEEAFRTTAFESLRLPAMAAVGEGALLAWVDGDQDPHLMLGRLDAAGDIVGSPSPIAETSGAVSVAMAADGSSLLWIDAALHVQRIAGDGTPRGGAVTVRTAPVNGGALTSTGGGTAVVWTETQPEAGAYLAMLDADGVVTVGPWRISGQLPEYTLVGGPAVIAAGDQLLVAWSEHYFREDIDGDPDTWDPEGHAVVRVARVAGDGTEVIALERLQSSEDEIIHIHPAFIAMDDGAVALSWSRGTFIPVCAGCVSDNTRRLVVLEPHDLVPLGEVIEMEGVTGFSSATMIAAGADFVHLLGLDYHAISNVALARTTCGPAS